MISAVLFDYGGVITTGGGVADANPQQKLAASTNMSMEQASKVLAPYWHDYMTGSISEKDMWHQISQQYGTEIPERHWNIWNNAKEMSPDSGMKELLLSLRKRGLCIGLLSNSIPNTAAAIRNAGWYELFDFTILSHEVGFSKPDPRIYQLALNEMTGISTADIVYLDDQERCLAPARALGMQTILVMSPAQAITYTEQMLA